MNAVFLARRGLAMAALALLVPLAGCGGGGDAGGSGSSASAELPPGGKPDGYTLAWADEFDTPGLPDPSKWAYDTERNPAGWYNNELQYYAADRIENSHIDNGRLLITARKEDLTSAPDYGGQHYTSARLMTRGKVSWTYGFVEVRAKLPCGKGTWPAIWMLGTGGAWPGDGEIDIMEQVGAAPSRVFGTVHTQTSGGNGTGSAVSIPDACTAFHNYQLTWTPDRLVLGVDDRNYYQYLNPKNGYANWPFDKPQYLLLNLAVGGTLGGAVDDSIFPVQMEVDYVRVYQRPL